MTEEATTCFRCGAAIVSRTAVEKGGTCMPCAQGTRSQIDESRRRAIEERERPRKRFGERARAHTGRARPYFVQLLDGEVVNGGFHRRALDRIAA